MDPDTQQRLITINHQFYQKFAQDFSVTRQRLQPGVKRILETIPHNARLLDLGCGNGKLWRTIEATGFNGIYVGLDFSVELLQLASSHEMDNTASMQRKSSSESANGSQGRATFLRADLSKEDWDLALPEKPFDVVLAFAVLHHLPGHDLHLETLRKVRQLLAAQGRFIHSEWQFLNSLRLRLRIQPWEKVGLSANQVEPGDYLLDWRRGGDGLRYIHHFDQNEVDQLARTSGFKVMDTFFSDGENGNLGLYQIWEK